MNDADIEELEEAALNARELLSSFAGVLSCNQNVLPEKMQDALDSYLTILNNAYNLCDMLTNIPRD